MAAVLEQNTLRLVRVFNAPRERVFDAFVREDQFIQWMCPPSVHVVDCHLDVRPGARWHMTVDKASGRMITSGKYLEVKRPERLVFTWAHHATDDLASPRGHETTVHLEFRALGDKTELTLIHGPFADTPSCNAHNEGWTGSFDKLDGYLRRAA